MAFRTGPGDLFITFTVSVSSVCSNLHAERGKLFGDLLGVFTSLFCHSFSGRRKLLLNLSTRTKESAYFISASALFAFSEVTQEIVDVVACAVLEICVWRNLVP